MMNDMFDMVDIDDLTGAQRDIAEIIGIEAYKKLVRYCGGGNIYIGKADEIVKGIRDEKINAEFNGLNVHELAIKYGLTDNAIRTITQNNPMKRRPGQIPGQSSTLW